MKKNDIITVEIAENVSVTKSIAYFEGEKIFIEGGYEGELVNAKIIKRKRGRTEAVIVSVEKPAPYMCEAACRHFGVCGGCSLSDITYSEQLKLKESYVKKLFERAGISAEGFEPILPSPDITGYRNKMEYSFGDEVKDGELCLGMHRKNSHYAVTPLAECVISPKDFNTIRNAVLEYFRAVGLTHYNQRSKQGLLRHLIIRRSVRENTLTVNLVTTNEPGLDEEAFVGMLLGLKLEGKLIGIMRTFNDRFADAVIAEKIKLLYGKDCLTEHVCGLSFEISPFSFFQTNTTACELLYKKALEYAGDISDKTVFDLYCGTGTIAQIAAAKAAKVYGIELVEEAIDAAKRNATANNLTNCEFIAGDVLEKVDELKGQADVIILDPPRAGINPKALEKIIAFAPETFVYISCKAQSLVGELPAFLAAGYEIKRVCCVDMFPFTAHVECVVLMSRVKDRKS